MDLMKAPEEGDLVIEAMPPIGPQVEEEDC